MSEQIKSMFHDRVKCLGFGGWLFGHKFRKSFLDYARYSNSCWRCGYTPYKGDYV